MEDVKLTVTDSALHAASQEALKRGSGARGLRSVFEEVMMEIMFDIPSRNDIEECIVDEDVIRKKKPPILESRDKKKAKSA